MAVGIAKRSEKPLDVRNLDANEISGFSRLRQRVLEFKEQEGQAPFVLLVSEEQHEMVQRMLHACSCGVPWVDTEVLDKGYRQDGWVMGIPYTVV